MNTITTLKIPADLKTKCSPVQIGYDHHNGLNLDEMYTTLNCSLVQPVAAPKYATLMLWCDEEALCKAEPELNMRASILAGQAIYGDVLLVCDTGYATLSWSPDNPLPFIPCELDALAREVIPVF